MIARPERGARGRRPAAETIPFAVVDELTLGRVTGWPARRARELFADADWPQRLAALLREDTRFRTAILIASAGLRPVVERVLRGEPLGERAALRLLAYAVRMATRTTPFGMFASVGPVAFAAGEVRVDELAARVARANVDSEWLVGAVDALEERALGEGEDVLVATATALRREGGRFVLLDERKTNWDGGGMQYRSVTIAASAPVAHALAFARAGRSTGELVRELAREFSVEPERARSLVRKLAGARFLIAAARPAPLDDAPERLAAFARAQPSLALLAGAVRDAIAPHPGGADLAGFDATVARLRQLGPPELAQPVFFDATHAPLNLPENVRADVLRLADAFVRCSGREHLDAFRKRFHDRYETSARLVPLLELLGPHGIGVPGSTEIDRGTPALARRTKLAALVGAALAAGRREIALSDDDWTAIRPDLPDPPPPSLELGFHVLAPTHDAVAAGEYRIVPSLIASFGAGKTTGRFAKYQDDAFRARLREVVAADAPPGALTAEPLFVPQRARSGNVIAHPLIAQATIPINAYAGGGESIDLDDLLVGIAGGSVALWSRSRRRRVHVVWPHAFNASLAPPLARFFAYVARDNARQLQSLDLGELAQLPFVPRIALDRVVLRRATWTFGVRELRERGLAALAPEHGVARYAAFGDHDNLLVVDTASEAGAALLADQTRRRAPDENVTLAEAFVEDDDLWLRDRRGERYPGEYIVSLRGTAARTAADPAPVFVDETARTRTPGSEWCYLKLYANHREFRAQIAPSLAALGAELTAAGAAAHWFYVLYGDPDQHVRLRLRSYGDGAALRDRAIAFAEELVRASAVSRYALATYERELERYGGAAGIGACERLFHLDSEAALRGPAVDVLAGRERLEALAVPLLELLGALTTADERERWTASRRPAARAASQDEAAILRVLASATPPAPDDPRGALAREAAAACEAAGSAYLDVVDAQLHMHLNRRGVLGDEESDLRRLLWKALFARRSRRWP